MDRDLILSKNLADVKEITDDDYSCAFCVKQGFILIYSSLFSAEVVKINNTDLTTFIENIRTNCECCFDYVIYDFNNKTGVATFIYKNDFIYYTMYDDVFSNPYDFVKIKVDDVIIDRLKKLSTLNKCIKT